MSLTRFWTTSLTNWRFVSGQKPTMVTCQNPAMVGHFAFSYGVKNPTDPSLDNQDLVLKIETPSALIMIPRQLLLSYNLTAFASFSIMCLIILVPHFQMRPLISIRGFVCRSVGLLRLCKNQVFRLFLDTSRFYTESNDRQTSFKASFTTQLFHPSVCPFVSPYMSHDEYTQRHGPDASLPGILSITLSQILSMTLSQVLLVTSFQ